MLKVDSALVISGGGFLGAFSIGVEMIQKKDYDLYVGTSTGSLAILMLAQGKHIEAKDLFLQATNKTIYSRSPFNKDFKIKKGLFLYNLATGNPIGRTDKLLKTIREVYTEDDHNELVKTKELVVTVTRMDTMEVEYKSNKDYDWEQFTEWVWISTLAYPYAQTVYKNGIEYADGGFSKSFPVEYTCYRAKKVRGIVLGEENEALEFENDNIIEGILSIPEALLRSKLKEDIRDGHKCIKHGKALEMIFMQEKPKMKLMIFNPIETEKVYMQGLRVGRSHI